MCQSLSAFAGHHWLWEISGVCCVWIREILWLNVCLLLISVMNGILRDMGIRWSVGTESVRLLSDLTDAPIDLILLWYSCLCNWIQRHTDSQIIMWRNSATEELIHATDVTKEKDTWETSLSLTDKCTTVVVFLFDVYFKLLFKLHWKHLFTQITAYLFFYVKLKLKTLSYFMESVLTT